MLKKYTKFLLLTFTLLILAGCQQIMENVQNSPDSLSPEEVAQIYNQEQMMIAMNNHLENLSKSQSTIKSTFNYGDLTMIKSQENFETYQEQSLSGYEIQTTVSENGNTLNEQFVWNESGYHTQFHNDTFVTTKQTNRQPYVFLNFLQFLVTGEDAWEVEEMDDNTSRVTKKFEDPEVAKQLGLYLDLPIIISPNAEYQIEINYLMGNETGVIHSGIVNATIEDLGNEYKIAHELVDAQFNDEAQALNIDINAKNTVNGNGFVEQFTQANPIQLFTNYDMQLIRTENDETIEELFITSNTLRTNPYMELLAPISEDGIGDFGTVYEDALYYLEGDDVQSGERHLFNAYAYFANRILDQYENLEEIESGNDSILYYREVFEYDFDALTQAVGQAQINHFSTDLNNFYGIDYIIDNQTKRLINIVIWNGSDESDVINTTTGYYIGSLNLHNPSLLGGQIHQNIWDAMP